MIDFAALEDVLFEAVDRSSALGDTGIFIDSQDGLSPDTSPYVTIRIGDLLNIGVDGSKTTYVPSADPGEEIVRQTVGMRDLEVTFQAFTPDKVGNSTARTILAKLQADLGLRSYRDLLNVAGLGILDQGDVKWVPKINNTMFEGRAVLVVRFCVGQSAQDATGYITEVNATPVIDGVTLPVVTFELP